MYLETEIIFIRTIVEFSFLLTQGWPMALSGRDFVGIAQTGSGKTLGVSLTIIKDNLYYNVTVYTASNCTY